MGSETEQDNDVVLEQEQEEEEEVEKMEKQVKQMAERIMEYRATLSTQLNTALTKILAAQRPVLVTHFDYGSESPNTGPSSDPSSDVGEPIESGNIAMLAGEELKEAEKVQLLRQKISENASAIPVVLNRMKESTARLDKLQSCSGVIHPPFKRKRTNR